MVIFLHQRLAKLSVSLARLEFQEQFPVIIFLNGANLDKWRSAECGFFLQLSGLQCTTEQKHTPPTLPTCHLPPCLRWPPHPSTTACAHTRRRLSRWPPHRVAVVLKTAPHTPAHARDRIAIFREIGTHASRTCWPTRACANAIPASIPMAECMPSSRAPNSIQHTIHTPTHSSTHPTTQRHTHTRHHAPLSSKAFVEDGSRMRRPSSTKWM